MTHLERYWEMIQNHEVIVGYWVRQAVKNLIVDLKNPAYIYDTNEADKRIAFKECC